MKDPEKKRQYDRERYAAADKAVVMAARKAYYEKNKEKILARTREWTKKRLAKHREIIHEAKSVPCMDCGQHYHFCVMDFDHRPEEEKKSSVSDLARNWQVSEKSLLEEMAKCDVVCANCHRIRTFGRMKSDD